MKLASLFDGISGFPLAASRCGIDPVWSAEIDPQCRSVSARHFPTMTPFDDVNRIRAYFEPRNGRRHATELVRPDILCGGFPCQDLSVAGKRGGLAGSRSGLWFVFRRIIGLCRPQWHIGGRSGVRRLTPRECERLQGFPDNWTRYAADGKEISDSARYRMLGNSVAVPCVEWIIRRIVERTTP